VEGWSFLRLPVLKSRNNDGVGLDVGVQLDSDSFSAMHLLRCQLLRFELAQQPSACIHVLASRPLTLQKYILTMAIYDGVLNVVLRNPFEDKSKFFKKSQYVFGPRFILGTVFAFVGVFGFATSGLVWEFKGIELGLTALITSFIALLFSIVFLFPFSKAERRTTF
jgi:hypothetical protein